MIISKFKNSKYKIGAFYSVAASLKSFSTMFVGIVIMRWLNPDELGMWNAVSIFLSYVPFFQLGIQSGLNRELPILLGREQPEEAYNLVANAKGIAFIITVLFLLIGIILPFVLYLTNHAQTFYLGVSAVSLMAAFSSMQLHLVATYRSSRSFSKLAVIYLIDSIIIIASIVFVYFYHYYGILIYNVIIHACLTLMMYYYAPYRKLKFKIKKRPIIGLAKMGLVLMSFVQIRALAVSIPKWLILYLGNISMLGLYSPAMALSGVMTLLPGQFAQFFHPQMGYKYGQTGKAEDIWPYVKKMLWGIPLISLPVCLIIWFTIPWLLDTFFPKYIESLWPMRIMSVGFVFSAAFTTHGVLYTIKAYKAAYIYSFIELLGYVIWPIMFTLLLDYNVLWTITMGITLNNIILYSINAFILKHVLFQKKYNV